jgi:hypothetical protein
MLGGLLSILEKGWFQAVLAILLFWLALAFAKKERRLTYFIENQKLFGGLLSLKKFQASFSGKKISELHRCRILIWNAGKRAIQHRDVVGGAVTFTPTERVRVLSVGAVATTASAINPRAKFGSSRIEVTFDYLDWRDGFVIEVLSETPSRWEENGIKILESKPTNVWRHGSLVTDSQNNSLRFNVEIGAQNHPMAPTIMAGITLLICTAIIYNSAFLVMAGVRGLFSWETLASTALPLGLSPLALFVVVRGIQTFLTIRNAPKLLKPIEPID